MLVSGLQRTLLGDLSVVPNPRPDNVIWKDFLKFCLAAGPQILKELRLWRQTCPLNDLLKGGPQMAVSPANLANANSKWSPASSQGSVQMGS